MPKLNTTVKSVRIDNDKLDLLEKRLGGRSINSWLNEQIAEYVGGKPKNSEKSLPTAKWEDMGSMAGFFQISIETLLDGIYMGLEDGYLTYQNGKVVGMPEIDFSEFKEVCGSKDPQKVLDDITRKIRSGLL